MNSNVILLIVIGIVVLGLIIWLLNRRTGSEPAKPDSAAPAPATKQVDAPEPAATIPAAAAPPVGVIEELPVAEPAPAPAPPPAPAAAPPAAKKAAAKAPAAKAPAAKKPAAPKPAPAKPVAAAKPAADKPVAAPKPKPKAPAKPKAAPAAAAPATPDNLLQLKGVGPKLVALLTSLGITRFDQIAGWTDEDVARIDPQLGNFKGRIARDKWIEQAGYLAKGDVAGFEAKFGKLDSEN